MASERRRKNMYQCCTISKTQHCHRSDQQHLEGALLLTMQTTWGGMTRSRCLSLNRMNPSHRDINWECVLLLSLWSIRHKCLSLTVPYTSLILNTLTWTMMLTQTSLSSPYTKSQITYCTWEKLTVKTK